MGYSTEYLSLFQHLLPTRRDRKRSKPLWEPWRRLELLVTKIILTLSSLLEKTLKTVTCGCVTCPQLPAPKSMLWTYKRNSIRDSDKDRLERLVFALSVKSSTPSALMSSSVKSLSTVPNVDSSSSV